MLTSSDLHWSLGAVVRGIVVPQLLLGRDKGEISFGAV